MASALSDNEIKNVKKRVFLALKKDIDKTIDDEIKKILSVKKSELDPNELSYL